MLTEFLRSFTLPGLEKKYIVADDSLTEEGAAADSKKVGQELAKKVDKETGKALSTNDYTNAEKTKLAGVDSGAQVNTIEGVKVDGTEVTPDAQKKINLNVYDKAAINAIVQEIYAEVAKKLNIDGYSELATVGNALGLVTDSVVEDKEPYNFRSLAHLPAGKFCCDTIVGGSVVWNQMAALDETKWDNKVRASITFNGTKLKYQPTVSSATLKAVGFSISPNHKYLITGKQIASESTISLTYGLYSALSSNSYVVREVHTLDTDYSFAKVWSSEATGVYFGFTMATAATADNYVTVDKLQVIDLTAALTPTIADYIYSLETATPGAGVAYFKKYFPGIYYGYAEPHFEHVQTSAKETVGFNQWDEIWERGSINTQTGADEASSNQIRSSYIPVFPNTTYYCYCALIASTPGNSIPIYCYDADKNYIGRPTPSIVNNATFVTPGGCSFIRFKTGVEYGGTYRNDICINLHGDRDGEYEPYQKRTYPIEPIVLRGIPKLDSANRLYFDGDIYRHDGSGEQRYSVATFNACANVGLSSSTNAYYTTFALQATGTGVLAGGNSVTTLGYAEISVANPGNYYLTNNGKTLVVCFTDQTLTTKALMDAYLANHPFTIVYKRATPEPFTAEPFQSPMVVDPLGTEEFVDYAVEQGDRDVKIPCGHISEYPEDLVDKLEILPHATGTNGDFLITEIDGKLYLKPYTQTVGLTSVSETEAE